MKKILSIKDKFLSRNASLLKHALKTGKSIIANRDDPKKIIESIVGKDVSKFVEDLAQYKGTITKAGQLLSQYGEYYLSPEVNAKLKLLHGSTHFLDLDLIKGQINDNVLEDFEISKEPLAAASIGQVHLVTKKDDQRKYILKIQYKGIEKAIGTDIFFISMLTKALNLVPKGADVSSILNEIENVMRKEMDYNREADVLKRYKELINDPFYKVPDVLSDYSNKKSIVMEYLEGTTLSELNNDDISKEKRNKLGEKVLELFLKEVFELGLVQTDAHGGNFLVNKGGDQLCLLDFGACLDFDKEVLEFYQNFMRASFYLDKEKLIEQMNGFINYSGHHLDYDEDLMWEYISKASSPMRSESYDWGSTKLPDELLEIGARLRKTMKFKSVPHHFIFLDRKLLGVFTILKQLDSEFDVKKVFTKFIKPL